MDRISCPLCELKFRHTSLLKGHLRNDHHISISAPSTTGFVCKTRSCFKSFKRVRDLLKHIDNMHSIDDNEIDTSQSEQNVSNENRSWIPTPMTFESNMAQLVSDLRFSTNVTGADMGRFVQSTDNLLSNIMSEVSEKIEMFLKYKNVDVYNDEGQAFLDQFKYKESFSNYTNIQGQIQALKNHYYYIEAQDIYLGNRPDTKLKKNTLTNKSILKESFFQYVPVTETLKLILSNEEVMNYVSNKLRKFEEDILSRYEDGQSFKENPFFKKYLDALEIHLYYDEFLVNNPLESKTHSQKIGAFYFSIANLPPHLHNYLGNVHVLAFGKEKDIKHFGINEFLKPFAYELKQLERDYGVTVNINNEDYILRATLLTVCADTLAAHEVLGFLGPSANLFCRLCTITSNERKNCPFTRAPLRDKESHEENLRAVHMNKPAESTTGVWINSVLNELKYFHCTQNFVFDCMHDILEGEAHYDLKLVIAHISSKKEFNLNIATLNHRINVFPYGPPEIKNKPSSTLTSDSIRNVSTDHKLQERASQTWCLLRIFPFLVSDKVPPEDPYLQHFINLNKINEIVFAPKLRSSMLPYLHEIIRHHCEEFRRLFPEEKAINKLHHLTHYPLCIQKSGPLRPLACFKDEAKHAMFKKYGGICCSFKNITKTMMNVSQMSQWGTKRTTIRKKIRSTVAEKNLEEDQETMFIFRQAGLHPKGVIRSMRKVQVYDIEYELNLFVATGSGFYSTQNMPTFGKFERIFLHEDQVYLYCKEYNCEYLEPSLNAYHISEGPCYNLVNTETLCDAKPFSLLAKLFNINHENLNKMPVTQLFKYHKMSEFIV